MVNAIVLLSVKRDEIVATAKRIAELDGVAEVYSVAGQCDLVAMLRTRDHDALAELVTNRLLIEPGIVRSETLFAFRVYSRYDLEHMFSIGIEETAARG